MDESRFTHEGFLKTVIFKPVFGLPPFIEGTKEPCVAHGAQILTYAKDPKRYCAICGDVMNG